MPEGAGTLFRQAAEHDTAKRHDDHASTKSDPETLLAISFLAGVLVLYV